MKRYGSWYKDTNRVHEISGIPRGRGVGGFNTPPPPRNSETTPKSC